MKIISINMKNVKCYKEAEFYFEKGINFINGVNGAGKTSIIESIAFALFDYKSSKNFTNYFIKRKEKKAEVRVVFLDKNNDKYIVERKIGYQSAYNSWIVKKIEDESEIVSGEENVREWLKQHLGFLREDNISQIYQNIIGVPQGMFTNVFLETDKTRKDKFDPIFNLDIYRKIFTNSQKIESGLKLKNQNLMRDLSEKQGIIKILLEADEEFKIVSKKMKKNEKERKNIKTELEKITKIYNKLEKHKNNIEELEISIENNKKEKEIQENVIKIKNNELNDADKGRKILEENEDNYKKYIKEIKEREQINKEKEELNKLEISKNNIINEIKNLLNIINLQEENIQKNILEKNSLLEELMEDNKELELMKKKSEEILLILNDRKIDLNSYRELIEKLDKYELEKNKIDIEKTSIKINLDKDESLLKDKQILLKTKQELLNQIKNKKSLEKDIVNIDTEINDIKLDIERNKENINIIKNGICPFLKTECLNVKNKTNDECEIEIIKLNKILEVKINQKKKILLEQKQMQEREIKLAEVNSKIEQLDNLEKEYYKNKNKLKDKEKQEKDILSNIYEIFNSMKIKIDEQSIAKVKFKLKEKEDEYLKLDKKYNILKTKMENLKNNINKKEGNIKQKEKMNETLENNINEEKLKIDKLSIQKKEFEKKKEEYNNLAERIEKNNKEMEITRVAYDLYIKNEKIALKYNKILKEINETKEKIQKIMIKLEKNTNKMRDIKQKYNQEKFEEIKKQKKELDSKIIEISIIIKRDEEDIEKLKEKLQKLQELKKEEKELEEKIEKYNKSIVNINKIRQIIKIVPESISRVLIQSVSTKAAEIYAKIAYDNTTLKWKEGYELVLIDNIDGEFVEKEFRQLSGGEQMSAALAIRIAMLEIITNVKIGILDEPTVNMDVSRREHLAEIIENVGNLFNQLFIVSHDDTFNSITDNIIQVYKN